MKNSHQPAALAAELDNLVCFLATAIQDNRSEFESISGTISDPNKRRQFDQALEISSVLESRRRAPSFATTLKSLSRIIGSEEEARLAQERAQIKPSPENILQLWKGVSSELSEIRAMLARQQTA